MIQIPDDVRTTLDFFGLSDWDARTTFSRADDTSVVDLGGGMVCQVCERGDGGRRLLGIAHVERQHLSVECVFVVPDTISAGGVPLETLAALCELYGEEVVINGASYGSLLVRAELPSGVVKMQRPADDTHTYQGSLRMSRSGKGTTLVGLGFLLDLDEILKDVA